MKNKIPKHVKEIVLQIIPKKGLVVKYIKEKPAKIFTKPIKLESKKRGAEDNLILFKLSGCGYCAKSASQIKKLGEAEDKCESVVKHEWRNKHDPYACAVYYKKIKIGYIPRHLNQEFINKAKKKIMYKFYFYELSNYDFENSGYSGPLIVAVKQS